MFENDRVKANEKIKLGGHYRVFHKFFQNKENGSVVNADFNGWLESIATQIHWINNVDYAIVGFSAINEIDTVYYRIPKEQIDFDGRRYLKDPLKESEVKNERDIN